MEYFAYLMISLGVAFAIGFFAEIGFELAKRLLQKVVKNGNKKNN